MAVQRPGPREPQPPPRQPRVLLVFDPFDTMWFRDGRPFEQTDAGLAEARAMFPPSPATLSGAALAAMARAAVPHADTQGTPWEKLTRDAGEPAAAALTEMLKVARPTEGVTTPLRFTGPFLYAPHPVDARRRTLFVPCPTTLVVNGDTSRAPLYSTLLPLDLPRQGASDLGETPLLSIASTVEDGEWKPCAGRWIALEDLAAYCRSALTFEAIAAAPRPGGRAVNPVPRQGRQPALLPPDALPLHETRIGLALDPVHRSAVNAQLYASAHLRPTQARLAMELLRPKELDAFEPASPAPLGGKGRFAGVDAVATGPFLVAQDFLKHQFNGETFEARRVGQAICLRIVALTPVPLAEEPGRFGLPALPSPLDRLVVRAAAIARAESIGMWDAVGRRPRVIRVAPAGSTWFVHATVDRNIGSEEIWNAAFRHRAAPAHLAALGFGAFLVGNWPDHPDRNRPR